MTTDTHEDRKDNTMTVKLPKQVQEANARAEKVIEDFKKSQEPEGDPGQEPKNTQQQPEADAKTEAEASKENQEREARQEPDSRKESRSDEDSRTDWKAKYLTLQGMYNADVPRLNKELKEAKARMDELAGKLKQQGENDKAQQRETAAADLQKTLSDSLGPEVADVIVKMMDGRMEGRLDALQQAVNQNLEPVKQQADQAASTSAQTRFEAALAAQVPDWRSIDSSEGFQQWLAEQAPLTGKTRQDLIVAAYQEGDVDRVAKFFESYRAEHAPAAGNRNRTGGVANADQGASDPLAEQEVPSRASSGAPNDGDKPTFTKAQVQQFYKDVSLGKIPPAKAAEMEAQIVAAGSEGRIR